MKYKLLKKIKIRTKKIEPLSQYCIFEGDKSLTLKQNCELFAKIHNINFVDYQAHKTNSYIKVNYVIKLYKNKNRKLLDKKKIM